MDFYQQVLGGTLEVNTFGEFGMTDAPADGVMHARLDSAAVYTIMASDLAPGQGSGVVDPAVM
jgi:PhnB protein